MNEKKVLLEKILDQNKHKRRKEKEPNSSINGKRPRASTKKIQLGWLNYDHKQGRFVAIRQSRGGGTRDVSLPLDASLDFIIETGQKLFFSEGSSPFGSIDDMEVHLANYKQDIIHNVTVTDRVMPFTLESYMHATKLPKLRLYLATKHKDEKKYDDAQPITSNQRHELINVIDDTVHDDDDVFSLPYFNCQEAQNIKAKQDKEYEASLQIHRAKLGKKKEQLEDEIKQEEQQEKLHQMRLERVPSDPGKGIDSVQIQIRHTTLGLIRRYFLKRDKMLAVYDWVGSQSILPLYFELPSFDGHFFTPEESVTNGSNCTLNMTEAEFNPGLDENEIEFKGFGFIDTTFSNADTDNDVSIQMYG